MLRAESSVNMIMITSILVMITYDVKDCYCCYCYYIPEPISLCYSLIEHNWHNIVNPYGSYGWATVSNSTKLLQSP